eukprot:3302531-Prymnesium_polylepis.1
MCDTYVFFSASFDVFKWALSFSKSPSARASAARWAAVFRHRSSERSMAAVKKPWSRIDLNGSARTRCVLNVAAIGRGGAVGRWARRTSTMCASDGRMWSSKKICRRSGLSGSRYSGFPPSAAERRAAPRLVQHASHVSDRFRAVEDPHALLAVVKAATRGGVLGRLVVCPKDEHQLVVALSDPSTEPCAALHLDAHVGQPIASVEHHLGCVGPKQRVAALAQRVVLLDHARRVAAKRAEAEREGRARHLERADQVQERWEELMHAAGHEAGRLALRCVEARIELDLHHPAAPFFRGLDLIARQALERRDQRGVLRKRLEPFLWRRKLGLKAHERPGGLGAVLAIGNATPRGVCDRLVEHRPEVGADGRVEHEHRLVHVKVQHEMRRQSLPAIGVEPKDSTLRAAVWTRVRYRMRT